MIITIIKLIISSTTVMFDFAFGILFYQKVKINKYKIEFDQITHDSEGNTKFEGVRILEVCYHNPQKNYCTEFDRITRDSEGKIRFEGVKITVISGDKKKEACDSEVETQIQHFLENLRNVDNTETEALGETEMVVN